MGLIFCLEFLVKVDHHELLHPLWMYNMTLLEGGDKKGPRETLYGYPAIISVICISFQLVWQLIGRFQRNRAIFFF